VRTASALPPKSADRPKGRMALSHSFFHASGFHVSSVGFTSVTAAILPPGPEVGHGIAFRKPLVDSAGQDARLDGRQDACRYTKQILRLCRRSLTFSLIPAPDYPFQQGPPQLGLPERL